MLKRIMKNEYDRLNLNNIEEKEIGESDLRISELLNKVRSNDKDLSNNFDDEIGININLRSKYYFNKGFEAGLQLANEIKDIKVKYD